VHPAGAAAQAVVDEDHSGVNDFDHTLRVARPALSTVSHENVHFLVVDVVLAIFTAAQIPATFRQDLGQLLSELHGSPLTTIISYFI